MDIRAGTGADFSKEKIGAIYVSNISGPNGSPFGSGANVKNGCILRHMRPGETIFAGGIT